MMLFWQERDVKILRKNMDFNITFDQNDYNVQIYDCNSFQSLFIDWSVKPLLGHH